MEVKSINTHMGKDDPWPPHHKKHARNDHTRNIYTKIMKFLEENVGQPPPCVGQYLLSRR